MGDSTPVSRIGESKDTIELDSKVNAESDRHAVLDAVETQDARPLASVHADEYLPPVVEEIELYEPLRDKRKKPSKLHLYSRPYTVTAPPISLKQGVSLLKNYLGRQKVVNLKNIKQVYLLEDVIKNPDRYPDLKEQSKSLSRLKRIPYTITDITQGIEKTSSGDEQLVFKKVPTFVLVPLHYVRLLRGNQAERNDFDSMLYHEVEGHGTDFELDSDYMINFIKFYGLAGVYDNAAMQLLMNAMEDVREFCAYLLELDRLVVKLDFHRNQSVVTTRRKDVVENHLVFHLTNILDPKLNNKGKLSQLANEFSLPFIKTRLSKVSPQTRNYFRKVLKEKGWSGQIPF